MSQGTEVSGQRPGNCNYAQRFRDALKESRTNVAKKDGRDKEGILQAFDLFAEADAELAALRELKAADDEVQRLKRVPRKDRDWQHQINLGKAQKRAATARKALK